MTSVCFGTAGVPSSGEPGRQGMSARQETIDRYRHFRAIATQHLGGALKHLSRTAIKAAAQRLGLWSRGKLVMDSPDELDLVFDGAAWRSEPPSRVVNDPRFPEAVYAAAIRQGEMQFMQF